MSDSSLEISSRDRPIRQRIARKSYAEFVADALEDSDVELQIDFGSEVEAEGKGRDPDGPKTESGDRGEGGGTTGSEIGGEEGRGSREKETLGSDEDVNDFKTETVEGRTLYFCSECGYQSNSSNNLKRHVAAVHKKSERFPCPHCKFVSYYRDNVRRHIQTVHDENAQKYSCSHCEFSTVHIESLRRHESLHRDKKSNAVVQSSGVSPPTYSCHKCDFQTEIEPLWLSHENNCHASPSLGKGNLSGYSCQAEVPQQQPANDCEVRRQQDEVYDIDDEDDHFSSFGVPVKSGQIAPAAFSRTYTCKVCKYSTTKSRLFLYHQINEHSAKFHVYPCDRCEYATRYRNKLHRHKKMVHGLNVPKYPRSALHLKPEMDAPEKGGGYSFMTSSSEVLLKNFNKIHESLSVSSSPQIESITNPNFLFPFKRRRGKFKCGKCFYRALSKRLLGLHARSAHKSNQLYRCHICQYSTPKSIEFFNHKSNHKPLKALKCSHCVYATFIHSKLEAHEKRHQDSCRFHCQFCGFPTNKESCLYAHAAKRHGWQTPLGIGVIDGSAGCKDDGFKADVDEENSSGEMEARFSSESSRDTTVLKVNPNKQLKCDFCNALAASIPDLQSHIIANHEGATLYQCTKCLSSYKRAADLNRHLKQKHGFNLGDWRKRRWREENHNYLAPYLRKIQPSVVIHASTGVVVETPASETDGAFKAESRDSSSPQIKPGFGDSSQSKDNYYNRRFSCTLCCKTYKWKGDLNVHLRRAHNISAPNAIRDAENKKGIYPCKLCPYVGKWKSEIQRHERIHTKTKPYGCGYCDYRSSWRGDMTRHLDKYHPAKNRKVIHFASSDRVDKVEEDPEDAEAALNQAIQRRIEREGLAPAASAPKQRGEAESEDSEALERLSFEKERRRRKKRNELRRYAAQFALRRRTITLSPVPGVEPAVFAGSDAGNEDPSDAEEEVDVGSPQDENPLMQVTSNSEENPQVPEEDVDESVSLATETDGCPLGGGGGEEAAAAAAAADISDSENKTSKMNLEHGTKCPHCDFVAPAPSKLRAHQIVHANTKPYKCTGCGKRANWKWDINKHIRSSSKCAEAQVLEMPPEEAESTIQNYLELCNQEGSSHHHHHQRRSGEQFFGNSADCCDSDAVSSLPQNEEPVAIPEDFSKEKSSLISAALEGIQNAVKPQSLSAGVPKKHNYMRPFKCSECGKRSNWKWDLRKHIGQAHQGNAKIIVMALEEAQATLTSYLESRNQLPVMEMDPRLRAKNLVAQRNKVDHKSTKVIPQSFVSKAGEMTGMQLPFSSENFVAAATHFASTLGTPLFPQWTAKPDAGFLRHASGDSSSKEAPSLPDTEEELTIDAEDGKESIVAACNPLSEDQSSRNECVFRCCLCEATTSMRGDMINHIEICHPGSKIAYKVVKKNLDCDDVSPQSDKIKYEKDERHRRSFTFEPKSEIIYRRSENGPLSPVSSASADAESAVLKTPPRPEISLPNNITPPMSSPLKSESLTSDEKIFMTPCEVNKEQESALNLVTKRESTENELFIDEYGQSNVGNDCSSDEEADISLDLSQDPLENSISDDPPMPGTPSRISPPKKHMCAICPYKTSKIALLDLHNQHHTPSEGNPYKCTLCDYWVCAKRLLKQHTRLHTGLPPPSHFKPNKNGSSCVNKPQPKSQSYGRFNEQDLQQLLIPFTRKDSIIAVETREGLPTMVPFQRTPTLPVGVIPQSTSPSHSFTPTTSKVGSKGGKPPRPLTASGHPISGDVERSRPFMCSSCLKRSNWKWDIMKHIREKHPQVSNVTVIELSTEEAKSTLNEYLRQRNQRPVITLPSTSNANESHVANDVLKKYYCEQCPYSTNSCKDSIYHQQFHSYSINSPLKCPHCNYWVNHRGKLTQHIRVHEITGIFGPYSSKHLSEGSSDKLPPGVSKEQAMFASLLDLSPAFRLDRDVESGNPIKVQDGIRGDPPVVDGETSGLRPAHLPPSKIQRQQIVDSNLRPFMCSVCRKRSNWKWDITKHIRSNHAEIPDAAVIELSLEEAHELNNVDHFRSASGSGHHRAASMPTIPEMPGDSVERSNVMIETPAEDSEETSENEASLQSLQRHWNAEIGNPLRHSIGVVSGGYVVNKSGHLTKDGGFRKLHRCRYCPYTNVRKVNLQLHEKMHGRHSGLDGKDLIQCPYCDYTVGNKGLLSHHLKVHMEKSNIYEDADPSIVGRDNLPSKFDAGSTSQRAVFPEESCNSDDSSLDESRLSTDPGFGSASPERHVPQFFCIRCPYSTESHLHYQRHLEMHGSQQKFVCKFCDYSVGTMAQLEHHLRLHETVNEEGNSSGYVTSSSAFSLDANYPVVSGSSTSSNSFFTHPNSIHKSTSPSPMQINQSSAIKTYKCNKCPFVNTRRDHLFAHLRCHALKSPFACPSCDYSVTKQHLLTQHLKVHSESYLNAVSNNMTNLCVLDVKDDPSFIESTALQTSSNASHSSLDSPIPNYSAFEAPMDLSAKSQSKSPPNDFGGRPESSSHALYNKMIPLKDSIKELRNFARHSPQTSSEYFHGPRFQKTSLHNSPSECDRPSADLAALLNLQQGLEGKRHRASSSSVSASQLEFAREHLVRAATALAASHAAAASLVESPSPETLRQNLGMPGFGQESAMSLAQAALVSREHPALALDDAGGEETGDTMWVCQFCDVGFTASAKLVQHEMDHLMGKIK